MKTLSSAARILLDTLNQPSGKLGFLKMIRCKRPGAIQELQKYDLAEVGEDKVLRITDKGRKVRSRAYEAGMIGDHMSKIEEKTCFFVRPTGPLSMHLEDLVADCEFFPEDLVNAWPKFENLRKSWEADVKRYEKGVKTRQDLHKLLEESEYLNAKAYLTGLEAIYLQLLMEGWNGERVVLDLS